MHTNVRTLTGAGEPQKTIDTPGTDRTDDSCKKDFSILVVDDEKICRELITTYLDRLGYKNHHAAADGFDAITRIQVQKKHFDIILLDLDMPGMDGMETLMRLQDEIAKKEMIIIVVSGSDSTQNILDCAKFGVTDFMVKPITEEMLKVRLQACIEKNSLCGS